MFNRVGCTGPKGLRPFCPYDLFTINIWFVKIGSLTSMVIVVGELFDETKHNTFKTRV